MLTMVAIVPISVALIAFATAWIFKDQLLTIRNSQQQQQRPTNSFSTATAASYNEDVVIYVIGDLHGDVECAQQWVQRTKLINPNTKEWLHKKSHLVFLGDYVDKGIQSRKTIEYVKYLTELYPQHVTALLGNHEIELLRDRTESIWGDRKTFVAKYLQLPYATVHPGEYLNYLPTSDITNIDYMVVEALYNATIEIYGRNLHDNVYFIPDLNFKGSILHLIRDESIRKIAQERLLVYQKAYLDTYRTGTELGAWLEQRPIIKVLYGTIFMHGGLSVDSAPHVRTLSNIQYLNEQFHTNAIESKLHTFIQSTTLGQVVYDLLVYRGNHKENACQWLHKVLPKGTYRIAVGHTPSSTIRITDCETIPPTTIKSKVVPKNVLTYNGYTILALDSALSRWFRNSGNDYCSGNYTYQSSNQQYTCYKKGEYCDGQIIRMIHKTKKVSSSSSLQDDEIVDEKTVQIDILTM